MRAGIQEIEVCAEGEERFHMVEQLRAAGKSRSARFPRSPALVRDVDGAQGKLPQAQINRDLLFIFMDASARASTHIPNSRLQARIPFFIVEDILNIFGAPSAAADFR